MAIDSTSVAQRQVEVPTQVEGAPAKRDLSLAAALSEGDKGFTESRTTVALSKDESHTIEDITSTEVQLVDDMKKVLGVLEELMRQNYSINRPGVFKELSPIVIKWHTLSEEEKHKACYKHFCHELNFFISKKDPLYF